jgi:hypothetical protein
MAALSRYFAAQVETSARNIQSMIRGGETFAQSDTSASIQSSTSLFAVRYAAPWYNIAEKTWLSAAYINREEAWGIFEPRIQQTADSFISAYSAAGEEKEALKQVFMYGAALGAAEAFIADLNFAYALNPSKTGQFDDTRSSLSQINVLMDRAKSESPVFIDCQDPSLKTALSNALSSRGLPVSREQKEAKYLCKLDITENLQQTDAGTMYTPAMTVTIGGGAVTLFSYSARLERIGAQNPDVARRRAYNAASAMARSRWTIYAKHCRLILKSIAPRWV